MHERIEELDALDYDDAHKVGRRLAEEVMSSWRGEMSYNGPVSVYVEGVGTYTLRIESDEEATLWDGNSGDYGSFEWDSRDGRRPSGFDGASRKFDSRGGPVWWQPPVEEKSNFELAERVRRFLSEDWSFVGVTLTLSIPGYEDQSGGLWGIETDCGVDYLEEILGDMQGGLATAPEQDAQTLATKLRRWVRVINGSDYEQVREAVSEMRAMADRLDSKVTA